MSSRHLFLSAFLLLACGPQEAEVGSGAEPSADDASELSTTELKVATTGITVWVRPYATKEVRDGRNLFVVRGRTSVNIENALSYVPDDAFGYATVLSARTFEVALDAQSETNSLLSGLPLLVRLDQPGGKNATLRFVLAPRFVDATGSSKLWVTTEVKPIYVVEQGLGYRGKVRAGGAASVQLGSTNAKLSRRGTGDEWNVDFTFEQLREAALGAGARFTTTLDGVEYVKTAKLALGVGTLELARTDDAYAYWPQPTCTAAVQACLNAGGATATDYESCGSYRQVSRCNIPTNLPQLGPSNDDPTRIAAALAGINASRNADAQVGVSSFWVQSIGTAAKPNIAQAIRAWQRQDAAAAGTTVVAAEQTAGQVNAALDPFGARTLVPAIQQTVLQQSFKAARLTNGTQSFVVLYFATAARFVVIRLPAP